MIRNLWSITKICCGCHEEPIAMRLQNGPKSVFYACPEYDKKYHGEKGCPNRVSTEIVEQILDILGEKIEEAEQKGEETMCRSGTADRTTAKRACSSSEIQKEDV